ncbi:MAG: bifunctional nicotinamidase/pyrazinamidase [Rickettsiales bacterium]
MKKALLIIDIQNDFISGSLAIPDGEQIVPIINSLMTAEYYDYIIASQDWHPANHKSFASNNNGTEVFAMGELNGLPQIMWPDHCVQHTWGAEFHHDLLTEKFDYIQQKGTNPEIDSYSAFRDNNQQEITGLDIWIKEHEISILDICGLATDFCVKFSAIDAASLLESTEVRFIQDASKALTTEGELQATEEMQEAGVIIANSEQILDPI